MDDEYIVYITFYIIYSVLGHTLNTGTHLVEINGSKIYVNCSGTFCGINVWYQ